MRYVMLTFVILSLVPILGCLGSSGSSVQWSENVALWAESKDTKINDGNINSEGETSPFISDVRDEKSELEADKYSQALLVWKKPQQIQRVIIKADPGDLEFFEIQYEDDQGNWQTLQSVQNNLREAYKFELRNPLTTFKLRLKVPRQWESRQKGGEKRRAAREGGGSAGSFKQIREIEVYYALPPETPAAGQPMTTQ